MNKQHTAFRFDAIREVLAVIATSAALVAGAAAVVAASIGAIS